MERLNLKSKARFPRSLKAVLLVVAWGLPVWAFAQPPAPASEPLKRYDYYQQDSDRETWRIVGTVEQNHLADQNFWLNYREKSWASAAGHLGFILRIVPNHPRALSLLEVVCQHTRQLSYPIEWYERALYFYPQYPITRARYGRYLIQIGQRAAGIAELRQALAADSTLIQARGWLNDAVSGRAPSQTVRFTPSEVDLAP